MVSLVLLITSALIASINCYIVDPGPVVIATKGAVWPKPQNEHKTEEYFVVRPHTFSFETATTDCQEFLQDAFTRYWNIIANSASLDRRGRLQEFGKSKRKKFWLHDGLFAGYLDSLNVVLTGSCPDNNVLPDLNMVENYTLTVTAAESSLSSESIWGILRGLETFTQSIYLQDDALLINSTTIEDYPRFPHRGLLLDTSRHFIPMFAIMQTLDAMAYNKFNVFHWHIVDDHSFPYKSESFPDLSEKGAYHPVSKVYQKSDVLKVIEYARVRGIRVYPEFDTPGHTRSWGVGYPELLTPCYNESVLTGQYGPMDPTKDNTYAFLTTLFAEVVNLFPDSYFHIGGDEVGWECWQSNPDIKAFMQTNSIATYEDLESYFIQKVVRILDQLESKYLVWEEVFVNGVEIPDTTVVHIWRDNGLQTLSNVTKAGKLALYSSCWYLDHLANGGDWQKFYTCEPYDFDGTAVEKELIIGGEACMWAEAVNEHNLAPRMWPRASATAERLWSSEETTDIEDAKKRLEEHACRMNNRGIPAQPPNGPGVCL